MAARDAAELVEIEYEERPAVTEPLAARASGAPAVPDDVPQSLIDAIKGATQAFGGKAAHYSALSRIESVPSPKAFAIPVFYYTQFMQQNGFDAQVAALLADDAFQNDAGERDRQLAALREAMQVAPVDAQFEAALLDKLATDYPGIRMRFRSSTNAEDLDGFTGAGLYTSRSGDPDDPTRPVLDAVRAVWASIWNFRAFEERTYRSIDHTAVGMARLLANSDSSIRPSGDIVHRLCI